MKVCLPSITANESLGESGIYMEVETRDRHFHVGVGCFIEAYCDGKIYFVTVYSMLLENRQLNLRILKQKKEDVWNL